VEQLKTALKVDMSQDSKTLNDVVAQLDNILFEEYIKARSSALKATIETGVLGNNMDWYHAAKPTGKLDLSHMRHCGQELIPFFPKEVRSYIYDALLSLVLVHSQVTAIARSLVSRTVGALVEELAKHALQAFSKVSRFGMGGMLQATLEMEFLHQTLNVHVSPTADATLQEIYKIISQAYRPQTNQDGANGITIPLL
jgi:exocyst complex component 2